MTPAHFVGQFAVQGKFFFSPDVYEVSSFALGIWHPVQHPEQTFLPVARRNPELFDHRATHGNVTRWYNASPIPTWLSSLTFRR